MSKIKCDHCHLEFDDKTAIKDDGLNFCCKGCQGVYHLLKDENLDSFYDKLGNKTIAPPLENHSDLSKFDSDSFEKVYIKINNEGFKQIDLIIEGIHCAACIWLNEKVLYKTDGIIEASINFTNNKAKIVFDDEVIKLSQVIQKIRSIGYDAYAYNSEVADEKASKSKRDYFIRMMVAAFATMNIMMLSVAKYTGFFTGISDEVKHLIHLAEFVLATPVLFYSGWIFFKGAYYGLKNHILNMDFLVATGAALSYIYSVFILFGAKGESYFDSVSMIITFVLVGKYLEVIGKKSAVDTLDTIKSQIPLETTIVNDNKKTNIAIEDVEIGDIIELKNGEKASLDGVLINGESSFDESSLTGESVPVFKNIGDEIYSGTINHDSLVQYRVTKTFKDSTFNSIVTLLEDSLSSKPKIEHKANEISKGFSLSILTLAIGTFLVWYFLGIDLGFDYEGTNHFEKSFIVAVSVIIIACPCALALATPMASLMGISELAKKKLLFKEAKYIEELARATKLVVDKTGTITQGSLEITKARIMDENIYKLNLLYSLVSSSSHPISLSIKNYLEITYDNLEVKEFLKLKTHQAMGLSAVYENVDGKEFDIIGGNIRLMRENKINYKFDSQNSVYLFAINGRVTATFELKDKLKPFAKEFIKNTHNRGIEVVMLTGDNETVASNIAKTLDIKTYVSGMNPVEKANYIDKLKSEGHTVIMAGDGVNDSIALSKSNVGISMGSGADISIAVSDIVLLNNSLESLNEAFKISFKTYKFIKQNLLISLMYNVITIPLAMLGFVIPLVAALSMSLSSLLVVGNSLRIKGK